MTLAYLIDWPDYQKYKEVEGFWLHAWTTNNENRPTIVVEKEWFDKHCKDGEDHSYTGD